MRNRPIVRLPSSTGAADRLVGVDRSGPELTLELLPVKPAGRPVRVEGGGQLPSGVQMPDPGHQQQIRGGEGCTGGRPPPHGRHLARRGGQRAHRRRG